MELKEYHNISHQTAKLLAIVANALPNGSLWSEDYYVYGCPTVRSEACNYNLSIGKDSDSCCLLAPDMTDLRDMLNRKYKVFVQYIVAPDNPDRFCYEVVDRRKPLVIRGTKTFANYYNCLNAGLAEALKYILKNMLNKKVSAELKRLDERMRNDYKFEKTNIRKNELI